MHSRHDQRLQKDLSEFHASQGEAIQTSGVGPVLENSQQDIFDHETGQFSVVGASRIA